MKCERLLLKSTVRRGKIMDKGYNQGCSNIHEGSAGKWEAQRIYAHGAKIQHEDCVVEEKKDSRAQRNAMSVHEWNLGVECTFLLSQHA